LGIIDLFLVFFINEILHTSLLHCHKEHNQQLQYSVQIVKHPFVKQGHHLKMKLRYNAFTMLAKSNMILGKATLFYFNASFMTIDYSIIFTNFNADNVDLLQQFPVT